MSSSHRMPRRGRIWLAAAMAATTAGVLAVTVGAYAGDSGSTVKASAVGAPPAGFTTTFSDDFTGAAGTGVNTGNWKYDTGPGSTFGTGEIETMTNSTANVFQDGGGNLVLKALHSGTDPRAGWTSGRVETQAATFGAAPGGVVRMESRLQQPNVTTANGAGYWPAFWMLGSPLREGVTWPKSGEVDILEDINGRSSTFGTLHCGVNPGGPCNESTGLGSGEHACPGCQTGFHNYAVEIDRSKSPEEIRWYLDGALYFTLPQTRVDATTWANAVDHPFFIIYDLAMGGGFPDAFGGGPNASTVSGGQMTIDWVAVYNKGPGSGSSTAPSSAPSAGPSPTVTPSPTVIPSPTATSSPTVTPPGAGTDLARGRPTTASSTENAGTPASAATDGRADTRWSSAFSDPQTLRVDLGASHVINKVELNWEAAYAKAFKIQTSADGTKWKTIYSTTTGAGGKQTLAVSGTGRYIRMKGTQRVTQYGYSLFDFGVYGS